MTRVLALVRAFVPPRPPRVAAWRRAARTANTMKAPSSSSGRNPSSTDNGEDGVAAVAVTWTWWAASRPARLRSSSATGIVVVNGCPLARVPATWPAGSMVTARTVPAPTSDRNRE
jgi:hypothetical protein